MAGAFLVHFNRKRAKTYLIQIIALSAGFLLGACFMHILPEAISLNPNTLTYVLAAFLAFYLMEQLIVVHPCEETECDTHKLKIGKISFLAFAIHSFLDGVAVTIGFSVNPFIGFVSAMAVILHELPEGIATVTLLHYAEYSDKKSLWLTSIVAIATPIGAIITYWMLPWVTAQIQGALLGLVAGSFLYISAADLIPETHRSGNKKSFLFVLLGLAFLILITQLIGH